MTPAMPLSEEEQRILRQIEHELKQDPTFSARGYSVSRRRMWVLGLGVLVGLLAVVASLAVSHWLAFALFVGVLGLATMFEREVRLVSRERLSEIPFNAWLTASRRPPRGPR